MLGILSLLILIHSVYSASRWRKFLNLSNQQSFLPIDILVELAIGITICLIAILTNLSKFKKIRQFYTSMTYDRSFSTKNFKTYQSPRAQILLKALKDKMNITQFKINV